MKPLFKILLAGGIGFGVGYYLPKIKKSVSKTWKEVKEKYTTETEDDVEEVIEDIKDQCCAKVEKIEDVANAAVKEAKKVTEKVTDDKEKK